MNLYYFSYATISLFTNSFYPFRINQEQENDHFPVKRLLSIESTGTNEPDELEGS